MYLIALIFPPLAVLLCGKPWQALLALFLTVCGVIPGVIYAWLIVAEFNADRRNRELIGAIKGSRRRGRSREPEPEDSPNEPFNFG